jgi:DNA-binding transcriptional MerR regulator/effector-binding domain-containing protein
MIFKIGEFARIAQISVRMLRHYDKLGLIKPAYIDHTSGYRYYSLDQLLRLYRLLALKDLGLSLEQVTRLLDEDVSTSELRGMLRLNQAELRQQIYEATLRLERVEQRLNRLEDESQHPAYDVIVKSLPSTYALTCARTLPPLKPPEFGEFFDEGACAIRSAGLSYQSVFALSYNPYAIYKRAFTEEWPFRFEAVFTVESADVPPIALTNNFWLRPRDVPGCDMAASTLHAGSDGMRPQAHRALCQWMEQHGYTIDGPVRDIYLRRGDCPESADHLTEIQYPIRKVDVVKNDG